MADNAPRAHDSIENSSKNVTNLKKKKTDHYYTSATFKSMMIF